MFLPGLTRAHTTLNQKFLRGVLKEMMSDE